MGQTAGDGHTGEAARRGDRPRREAADRKGPPDSMERSGVTVLGVVTARAGSKGIPGKNTRLLAGQPLITYTIEAARASGVLDRLILSTDDPHAAAIARERGC